MATSREYLQSIMSALVLAQNATDEALEIGGVPEILQEMDGLADELKEVLE